MKALLLRREREIKQEIEIATDGIMRGKELAKEKVALELELTMIKAAGEEVVKAAPKPAPEPEPTEYKMPPQEERPFVCAECEADFTREQDLKSHYTKTGHDAPAEEEPDAEPEAEVAPTEDAPPPEEAAEEEPEDPAVEAESVIEEPPTPPAPRAPRAPPARRPPR